MAVISKGIALFYKASGASEFTELDNLQEIAELGGDTESIEITTLADEAHIYTDGLKNYGDNLPFKFLYEAGQFMALNDLAGETVAWKVELPDGTTCEFSGTCSVKLDGVGVNAVLTYTLNIKPSSAMAWA